MTVRQRLFILGLFITGSLFISGHTIGSFNVTLRGQVTDAASGGGVPGAVLTFTEAESGSTLASGVVTDSQGNYEVSLAVGTGLEFSAELPESYWMDVPSPNPARGGEVVHVRYASPGSQREEPRLEIVDMLGRSLSPNARLAAGSYFLRLWFGDGSLSVSRQLVVSEAGRLQFDLLRQSREVPSEAPKAAKGGFMSASTTLYVRIEKADYVSTAEPIRLDNTANPERNFQISRASSNVVLVDRTVLGSATADASGALIGVTSPGSPIDGLEIGIPAGALTGERTISVAYSTVQNHSFGSEFNVLSPAIEIDLGGGYTEEVVDILIPVTVPAGHFAMAFTYDEATGAIEGLPATGQWSDAIQFSTRNLNRRLQTSAAGKRSEESPFLFPAKIIVASIPTDFLDGLSEIDTGFRPGTDDWDFTNWGSYLAPKGHCAGQAITMMWYYYEQKMKGQPALTHRYDRTSNTWQDNPRGYRFASVIQKDLKWDGDLRALLATVRIEPDLHILSWYAFGYSMLMTGNPQYVGLKRVGGGHAIVAYKMIPSTGQLFVSDPNFPGQERIISFSNGEFLPYSTKQSQNDTDFSLYPGVGYFATSSMVEWDQVSRRWLEFLDDGIGRDTDPKFPEVTLYYQNGTGFSELTDGLDFDVDSLALYAKCTECRWSLTGTNLFQSLRIFNGDGGLISGTTDRTDKLSIVRLAPGQNELGFYTKSWDPVHKLLRWLDFRWTNVNFTGSSTGDQLIWHLDFVASMFPGPQVNMSVDAVVSMSGKGATLTVDDQDRIVGYMDVGEAAHLTISPTFTPTDSTIIDASFFYDFERWAVGPARFATIDEMHISSEPGEFSISQNTTTGAVTIDFRLQSEFLELDMSIPFHVDMHLQVFDFLGDLTSQSRETIEMESLRILIVVTGTDVSG